MLHGRSALYLRWRASLCGRRPSSQYMLGCAIMWGNGTPRTRTAACKPSITQSALKDAQASCQHKTQHAAACKTVTCAANPIHFALPRRVKKHSHSSDKCKQNPNTALDCKASGQFPLVQNNAPLSGRTSGLATTEQLPRKCCMVCSVCQHTHAARQTCAVHALSPPRTTQAIDFRAQQRPQQGDPCQTTALHNQQRDYTTQSGSRLHLMSTILITEALPILCSATMLSPLAQYRERLACSMAAARISSVVSVSVARAEPSARRGMRPRVMRHCSKNKQVTTNASCQHTQQGSSNPTLCKHCAVCRNHT